MTENDQNGACTGWPLLAAAAGPTKGRRGSGVPFVLEQRRALGIPAQAWSFCCSAALIRCGVMGSRSTRAPLAW